MADWKIKWVCQDCGAAIWSVEQPEERDCKCPYEENEPYEQMPIHKMTKPEAKARYRIQYGINGYSWLDKKPWMCSDEDYEKYVNSEL